MRFIELLQLIVFVLVFELLLYVLSGGISTAQLMLFSTAYAVILIITYFYIFSQDIRKSVALSYISLSVALIFGYSVSGVAFRSPLDPYYISLILAAISATNFIPAFLVMRQRHGFIVPHILIIASLPVAMLDPTGYASPALIAAYIVLSNSLEDLIIYAVSLMSIYAPYLILPLLITNIKFVPNISMLNMTYMLPGFELKPAMFFMSIILIYTLVGCMYLLIKKRFLPEAYGLRDILIRTATSYVLCVAAVLTVVIVSQNVISVPQATRYGYLVVVPLTASIFALLNAFNEMLTRSNVLRSKAMSMINSLRSDLNLYASVIEEVSDASTRLSINEVKDSLTKISKELDNISWELSKSLTTARRINEVLNRLDTELSKSLNSIKNSLLNKFASLVNDVKNLYNSIALTSGLMDSHVSDMLKHLEGVNDLEALPDALLKLKKVLKRLCDLCGNVLSVISTYYREVLGKEAYSVNAPIKCSEDLVMLDVIKIYMEFIDKVHSEFKDEVMTTYSNLTKLGRDLEALINSFKDMSSSEVLTALNNLRETFKVLPEFGVTPIRALFNIREVCMALRDNLTRFLDAVNNEVHVRELEMSNLIDLKDIKLDYLTTRKSDVSAAVNELLTYIDRPCRELVEYLVNSKLKPLSELLGYVKLIDITIKRAKYLSLFIKYLDDRLSIDGSINVDEIPLPSNVLSWLLSIYLSSRGGVVYDGRVIKRELSGTS